MLLAGYFSNCQHQALIKKEGKKEKNITFNMYMGTCTVLEWFLSLVKV
jgi:hypothetical protein